MRETESTAPPLTADEAADMLNVSRTSIYRMNGLVWLEYQASGKRPIRRITRASVERLLQRREA